LRNAIILLIISSLFANESTFNPEDFRFRDVYAVRLEKPLVLDGLLSEDIYSGPFVSDFIQYAPNNGNRATEKTDMWIGYDDEALYVGARMWDASPDSIVTRIGRRDDHFNSDLFEVIIDSYNDKRTGFSFQINPSGAIRDETYYNDSWTDLSWDGIWEGKTSIDDKGWTAELRIPYSQLRFDEQEEYTWGIFPTRYIQRRGEWDYFMYKPLEESGAMSKAATLHGIRGIKPPRRLSAMPYFASSTSNLPSQENNAFTGGRRSNIGIGTDIRMGIGGNLTLDATINPDFGQVEVDPSSINLSAYETYYAEKRPFFVEGRSIFDFGSSGPTNNWGFNWSSPSFFYSRRIGRSPQGYIGVPSDSLNQPDATRILGAVKVSGKLKGDWSVGVLSALTSREFGEYYLDGKKDEQQIEPLTSYNVLRAQKEIADGRRGIGFIGSFTNRSFNGSNLTGIDGIYTLSDNLAEQALTFGVDGWNFFGEDRDWALGAWAGMSHVSGTQNRIASLQKNSSHYFQRPDADHLDFDPTLTELNGFAGRLSLNKEQGNIQFNTALGAISPGFDSNDLGRTSVTDRINQHTVIGYRWTEPGKTIRSARVDFAYQTNHNFSGVKNGVQIISMGYASFLNYWGVNYFYNWMPEVLSTTALRGGPAVIRPTIHSLDLGVNSDGRKQISGDAYVSFSTDAGGGHSEFFELSADMNFGDQFNVSIGSYISNNLEMTQYIHREPDSLATAMFGNRYIVGQMEQHTVGSNIRISYTFTPKLSLQAYIQPYLSVGKYSHFKEYAAPETYSFINYGDDAFTVTEDGNYVIDPQGDPDTDDQFTIYNPDFNSKSLVGTAVLRWEFSPGSTAFLVWTRNGSNYDRPGVYDFARDMGDVLSAQADDFIALKVTYLLGK